MKKQFKVPFDKNGNHMTTTQNYQLIVGKEVDNYEFKTTLKYQGWERSRSGIFVIWADTIGRQYKSSMIMLDEVLNGSANATDVYIKDSLIISGTFTFKKQGTVILLTLK